MNYEIAKLALLLAKLNSEGNVIRMLESIAWQMGISNVFEVVAQLYLSTHALFKDRVLLSYPGYCQIWRSDWYLIYTFIFDRYFSIQVSST
jgi:hypothetical protein